MEKTQGFIYLTWLIWTDIDRSSLIGLIRDLVTMNQLVILQVARSKNVTYFQLFQNNPEIWPNSDIK